MWTVVVYLGKGTKLQINGLARPKTTWFWLSKSYLRWPFTYTPRGRNRHRHLHSWADSPGWVSNKNEKVPKYLINIYRFATNSVANIVRKLVDCYSYRPMYNIYWTERGSAKVNRHNIQNTHSGRKKTWQTIFSIITSTRVSNFFDTRHSTH